MRASWTRTTPRSPGSSASEFIVREDDVAREVLRVSAATEPLQIALLVDTSQAIEEHCSTCAPRCSGFFKQMGGKHEIALIGLGERPTVLSTTRAISRVSRKRSDPCSRDRAAARTCSMRLSRAADGLRRRKATRPHIIVYSGTRSGVQRAASRDRASTRCASRARRCIRSCSTGVASATGSREEQELAKAVRRHEETGGRREDLLTPWRSPIGCSRWATSSRTSTR